jgi:drug/metabolite transporter (DMT)-like permease
MTPGLGLAAGAMICFGLSDLIYKRAAKASVEPRQFIMQQAWVFCPGITLYAWLSGTLHLNLPALWGAFAGLFALAGFFNFIRSLESGAVSTNAPIFRLNFTITAALAIVLLGEAVTSVKIAALSCALIAVWLLLAEPASGPARPSTESLVRVLIATVAIALANLFYKIGLIQGAVPETMVATQAWVFCSSATFFGWLHKRRLRAVAGVWRYSAPAALVMVVGYVLMLHGLARGPASVLVPVTQMGFVFTAVLGVLMFGEPFGVRKRVGLAVAIAALALFAVS